MPETCEVLIVGGGVIGCSIAFQLARMGQRGVRIVERETVPGSGSTAKANGGIRAQFTTEVNLAMSLASMDILDALAEEIGHPPVYKKAGYLFLTGEPAKFEAMTRAAAFQRERGVTVQVLDERGVRAKVPWVSGPIVGGTFGARDGFIDPGGLCNFFLREATRAGVSVRYGSEVIGIERDSGAFRLHGEGFELRGRVLIDAAGAWSKPLAAMLGVSLPVEPVRRHLLISGPCPELPDVIPMVIDADSGVLVRREGDRVLIAYSNPDEPAGYNLTFDRDFPERIAEPMETRFPIISAAGLDLRRSWSGLYEVTPDHHAVIGPVPGVPGFFVCAGFSGHGVMHSAAAGRSMAELVTKGRSSIDLSALSIERFARGELIHETMVL
jgi:sarcosine oxidase subunit beta